MIFHSWIKRNQKPFCTGVLFQLFNPNSVIHHQTSQKLSPKHAARGVAQSPYPIYRHGKACLSKQPPWRAAGDPRLARGRSRVRAPGPAGALRALFFSTLPSFLLREIVFFVPSPQAHESVRDNYVTLLVGCTTNPNSIIHHQTSQKLSPKHAARGVAQSPYPIYRHGKACLCKQPPWRAAGDPRLARGRSRVRALGPAGALLSLFFLHPPFLPPSGDSFFRTFPTKPTKVLGLIWK